MLMNPDPLKYPGSASTAGGAQAPTGADTNAATSWIQQQPWYRQTLASWGNPPTLSLGQRGYLARTAQQAGLNPDFGINTDGSVEDWSTPTGSKIALAAFGAAAGAGAMGLLGGGGAAALGPSTAGNMAATDAAMAGSTVPASLLPASGSALGGATSALLGGGAGNLTKALLTLGSALGGHAIASATSGNAVPPQLNDLLNQSVQRQKELAPLGTAATAGMYQMLPDFAKTPQAAQGAQALLGVK